MLTLDVLIPSRNRARELSRAIESLLSAPVPDGLKVTIVPIDNGSTDETASRLEWFRARFRDRIQIVHERRCGKSRALNAGIAATASDLVGMIDDDEEIGHGWYEAVWKAFTEHPKLDFIGGPYRPVWSETPPEWIPHDYLAVLGDVDSGTDEQDYGPEFGGILKGGNAIIRREALLRAGPYAEYLGPAGAARLLSCEDEEMYWRLLKSGARGRYLPSLIVHHHVSAARLSPAYFRRWCFWRGVSRGLMDRRHPLPVRYLAGVPRFLYGSAARGLKRVLSSHLEGGSGSLSDELKGWDLAGYFWGRHIYTLARFSPIRSRRTIQMTFPQIPQPEAVTPGSKQWNSSCYPEQGHDGQSTRDCHPSSRFGLDEHRRTSASSL